MKSVKDQIDVFKEGAEELISEEELSKKLEIAAKEKRPLRVKYGADPSAPDIHLGHTVPLRKLREIQELGHTVVFIIGDFTARIGDPSGVSETRKALSEEEVKQNAITYQEQVFKILNKKQTEVRYNSEWLDALSPTEFLTLTSRYTVARLLERDDFNKRFKSNLPIAVIELLYPLLQGYDSVVVDSDVEVGGTDQKFNLLVGRELQRDYGKFPQAVLTLPILEGTDGVQKMSKSLGNYIGVQEEPSEIFGKVMSVSDTLMLRYMRYFTGWDRATCDALENDLNKEKIHPKEMKVKLAKQIVSLYYDESRAEEAYEGFEHIFKNKKLPEDMPLFTFKESSMEIGPLLFEIKLVSSKSEARRLIEQGGVKVNQEKITDTKLEIDLDQEVIIQCGKRKFARVCKA